MLSNKIAYDQSFQGSIIGIDEAGRGCWCGPVVICGVVILNYQDEMLNLINDSKQLSPKKRETIYQWAITNENIKFSIKEVSPQVIDEINILEATRTGFKYVGEELASYADIVIADAMSFETQLEVHNIIKADEKSLAVGLASIIAKVYRDNLLIDMAHKYPDYGFEKHKGYGTKMHREALEKFGVINDFYRLSYKPIKKLLGDNNDNL